MGFTTYSSDHCSICCPNFEGRYPLGRSHRHRSFVDSFIEWDKTIVHVMLSKNFHHLSKEVGPAFLILILSMVFSIFSGEFGS